MKVLLVIAMCFGLACSVSLYKRNEFSDAFAADNSDDKPKERSLDELKAELIRVLQDRLNQGNEEDEERKALLEREAAEKRAQAEEADERELEDMKAQLVRALQERLNRDESERNEFADAFAENRKNGDGGEERKALFEEEADEERAQGEEREADKRELDDLKAQLIRALEAKIRETEEEETEREVNEYGQEEKRENDDDVERQLFDEMPDLEY